MPSKVSLTVGSLLAVSVIIAVASRLSCVADFYSSYMAPGETDEFMDDCDNLEARGTLSDLSDSDSCSGSSDEDYSDADCSEYKIVSEGRILFDKDEAEAGTARQRATDAYGQGWIATLLRTADAEVNKNGEKGKEFPVRPWNGIRADHRVLPHDWTGETDNDDEKRKDVKGPPAWPFGTLENEREAGACTAWRSTADAFDSERIGSVPRVAGVEESGDEDQEEALVKSWDDMEAPPGSLPSDWPYDADDDETDDDDDVVVWDKLQSFAKEPEDAQQNSSTLRLQLDEARADVCALQIRVAQHETHARLVSEDNATLHVWNRRLQAQLQEASNENATLREGLAGGGAARGALKGKGGKETELRGTKKALQGLREAHVELIEAAFQSRA
ncbi:hypothetical protein MY11210_003709 [Beauveria gryllotalpidicola]